MLLVLTLLTMTLLVLAMLHSNGGILLTIIGALVALIPASDLAASVLNWDITHTFPPKLLPKIDLAEGVPAEACTMVVVPVILFDEATVDTLIDKLEIAYLANQDEHLHFALLGDFTDAEQEQVPGDQQILGVAGHMIEELNRRYSGGQPIRFHLFHSRALRAQPLHAFFQAIRASIPTRRRHRTCIRISLAKAFTQAKVCTTSTLSSRRLRIASLTKLYSATICLNRSLRARLWLAMWSFSMTIRLFTTRMRCASIAGLVAIGRLPDGSAAAYAMRMETRDRIAFRQFRVGKFWTTCAAVCSRRRSLCC